MKVVLFCGGLGMRMRDYSHRVPKPMAMVRNRPLLWHVMRWYAHWGHKDFILCLGHRGEVIKEYFLSYSETLSNDFVLSQGGRQVELLAEDIADWRITFVDTGLHSNIGQRLRAVRPLVENEQTFLANYSDGLTDADLPSMLDRHYSAEAAASFLAVRPCSSLHAASIAPDGSVLGMTDLHGAGLWINGGYFVLSPRVFEVLGEGEELVEQPFARLIARGQLFAHRHEGFWRAVDTFKDLTEVDEMAGRGHAPWEVWRRGTNAAPWCLPAHERLHRRAAGQLPAGE